MKNILAVDIGGSKLLVGIVDDSGKTLAAKKSAFFEPTQESILKDIFSACDAFAGEYEISGIGVSIPGLADPVKGIWVEAVFSGVRNFPLGDLLRERYRVPVFVENDANNSAFGEKYFGCAAGCDDFIWLTVSNGCGAGVFLGGGIFRGAGGNAGELGHIRVTEENCACPCGNTGCLEAAAAGPGISRRYGELTGESLNAKEIAEKARAGDETALAVYKKTGVYIGRAIAAAVNTLNVPLVVIGGGISGDFDLFRDDVERTVREQIYRTANGSLRIARTELGYNASLIGAAANVLDNLKKKERL